MEECKRELSYVSNEMVQAIGFQPKKQRQKETKANRWSAAFVYIKWQGQWREWGGWDNGVS